MIMKKLLVFTLLIGLAYMGMAQEAQPASGPVLTFKEKTFNFGEIYQGDKVTHVFTFENTGTEPLILSNVLVQCGCTATKWPKEPIEPGKTGEIEVEFNSAGKMGMNNKAVTAVSNATNSQERVTFTVNVLPKKRF